MHIGVDISQIIYEGTGVARFTDGLVRSLLHSKQAHRFSFFCSSLRKQPRRELLDLIRSAGHSYRHVPLPSSVITPLWNNLRWFPMDRLLGKLDWLVTSDWSEPPATCKKATIVHDFVFRRYPETVAPSILKVMQRKLELVARESSVIFADSQATANDAQTYYSIPGDKIVVNYPGVETGAPASDSHTTKRYSINKPFYITVGKLEPRKNLDRLFTAFNNLNDDRFELLVVGPKGWGDQPKQVPGVRFLGFVPDADLWQLYRLSMGLIFPSLWEGFGYPAVEAMHQGTPVALSNRSSLAEIGQGTALFFDPEDTADITRALQDLQNEGLRGRLSEKSLLASKKYSWDRYAQTMIETLEERR